MLENIETVVCFHSLLHCIALNTFLKKIFSNNKMPSTTYTEFGKDTEAFEVAKAFADRISDKTIIVTGANSGGIAYTTLEAFVGYLTSVSFFLGHD